VWKREIDGKPLTFRLAGINNQNFLMRDEETGSYWQQISGLAVSGPMRGRQLELVHSDEITFSLWKQENPGGTVLQPVGKLASKYEKKDWETRIGKAPTVVDTSKTPFGPRELMLGVVVNGAARAYVMDKVLKEKLIQDNVGGTPLIVLVGPDAKSVRVFEASMAGQADSADFYRDPDADAALAANAEQAIMMDSLTGSRWAFNGCAVSGPAAGQCLQPVYALKDYWFDWQLYHPKTTVFAK
jgi:hypothetical protein